MSNEEQAVIEFQDGKVWLFTDETAAAVLTEMKARFGDRARKAYIRVNNSTQWPKGFDYVARVRTPRDVIENEVSMETEA